MEVNFKLTNIIIKKFHKEMIYFNFRKDVFSILVNWTFLYICVFSTQLIVLVKFSTFIYDLVLNTK